MPARIRRLSAGVGRRHPVTICKASLMVGPISGVRRKFSWGDLVQGHMVVICIWCSLFVTSQFDVIYMFPNQSFGEVS